MQKRYLDYSQKIQPKVKSRLPQPKKKKRWGLRFINAVYLLLVLTLIGANSFFIFSFTVEKKTPTQALSSLAKSSLQVVDNVWQPQLKKTANYTAGLIMGIDSRDLKFDGETFSGKDRDIDTMMQVVFNHDTGQVFMISIPRDTGVTITEECAKQSKQYFKSINHAYKLAEDGNCPGGGEAMMMKYVTSVTGFENHYFAIISYDAFREIINALGEEVNGKIGLYIDVQKTFTDYYPREQGGGFERVSFKKGYQFIDSVQLLKYARVRKSSSDFDRAQRQQQVISALQNRVLNSGVLTDPVKIFELYQVFQKNALFSQINLDDIRGALSLVDNFKEENVHKIVLDDNFGGKDVLLTKPFFSSGKHNRPGYYLSPVAFNNPDCIELKDEYCKVKAHLQGLVNQPAEVLKEAATIEVHPTVANKVVTNNAVYKSAAEPLGLNFTVSKTALKQIADRGEIQIYDFSEALAEDGVTQTGKLSTAKLLADTFKVEIISGKQAPFSRPSSKPDFVIVVKV